MCEDSDAKHLSNKSIVLFLLIISVISAFYVLMSQVYKCFDKKTKSTIHKHVQCDMIPLQQVVIHPDETVNVGKEQKTK